MARGHIALLWQGAYSHVVLETVNDVPWMVSGKAHVNQVFSAPSLRVCEVNAVFNMTRFVNEFCIMNKHC